MELSRILCRLFSRKKRTEWIQKEESAMRRTIERLRKGLSIILAMVCLVTSSGVEWGMLSVRADDSTGVFLNGVEITGDGANYSYSDNVLTITGYSLTGSSVVDEKNACIYASHDLTIKLVDTNELTTDEYGIYCTGTLTIEGNGELVISGSGTNEIYGNNVLINNGTITAGTICATETVAIQEGVVSCKTIKACDALIKGGQIEAKTTEEEAALSCTNHIDIQGGRSTFHGLNYGVKHGGNFKMISGMVKAGGSNHAIEGSTIDFSEDIVLYAGAAENAMTKKDTYEAEPYLYATSDRILVTLDAQGGSTTASSIRVAYGGTYGSDLPTTATKNGYDFLGWYTQASGGNKVTASTQVTRSSAHVLYAHWAGRTGNVVLDAGEGVFSNGAHTQSITVTSGLPYGELRTPTLDGFAFEGWYTAADGGMLVTATTIYEVTNGTRLYAHWRELYCVVTFDGNSGVPEIPEMVVHPGKEYGILPSATKAGYIFEGWFTLKSGGQQIKSDTKVLNRDDHTLFAHWKGEQYTVIFEPNEGTVSVRTIKVTNGNNYGALPTPSRKGYKFLGWFTDLEGGIEIKGTTKVELYGDQTLYAHWVAENFTVTFNAGGGKVSPASKKVEYGEYYGDLPIPNWDGHIFDGWFTSASGGEMILPTTRVEATTNHSLYAHWTEIKYTVTLNPNGGILSTTTITVNPGKTYGNLPTPTRDGYKFEGWFTESTGGTEIKSTTKVEIAGDHILYAHWKGNEIVVTFDPNGGEVDIASKKILVGDRYGDLPTPSREGFYFEGWYSKAKGGSRIDASSLVENPVAHSIYAHWRGKQYEVLFDSNGGSVDTYSCIVTIGEIYGELPDATRTGYSFLGWYTAAKGGTKVTSETIVETAEDHILYAHWRSKSYRVTFDPNGGYINSKTTKKYVSYGKTYEDLPVASRRYYRFVGWYTQAKGGTPITSETKVKILANQTVYAHWSRIYVSDVFDLRVTAKKRGFKVEIDSGYNVDGNQVRYTTYCTMKKAKTFTMGNIHSKLGLKSKTTYYVQVRSYRIDSTGKKVYGEWSVIRRVRTK